jgi:hypothetical protein
MKKRIAPSVDEVRQVEVAVSPHGDAAEWTIGISQWRMQRVNARWELFRVGRAVEIKEGRFRAFDDAVAYSLGWCRGLASSIHALGAAVDATLGEEFVDQCAAPAPEDGEGGAG